MADAASAPESLISEFKFEQVLNQDQAGRRIILRGHILTQQALLILERAPFPTIDHYLTALPSTLARIKNLGANDVYYWYLGNTSYDSSSSEAAESVADLKINLIFPCTEQHVRKYSRQDVRVVVETEEIYRNYVKPYVARKREEGRLNWVFNIIEGKTEVEDVILRMPMGEAGDEGFLLLPDLNWDRKTRQSLHLLGLVERRDIWSLRDLKKRHVPWLRRMRDSLISATLRTYEGLESDQLKLYVHYQPTYYHFHIHVVHVALEGSATQAVGKAIGLESIISQLEHMAGDADLGMETVTLHYTIGEASELWKEIFEPLKTNSATATVSPPQ